MTKRIHGRLGAAALLVTILACRHQPEPAIVVEADTTRGSAPAESARVEPDSAQAEPEVVVIEERVPAPARGPEPGPAATRVQERGPDVEAPSPEAEVAGEAGPIVLREGTRLVLELKTPLHSASTRVGDRFAARTAQAVEVEGRTAIEAGALVEGRVAAVVSAGSGEEPGRIELDFRSIELPSDERLPLHAEIASVAGRPAEPVRRPSPAAIVGGAAVGAGVGGAVGGRKGAAIGAIVGAFGTTLIAGARDHEVVVPSGTEIEITLTAPLEIPPE